MPWSSKQHRLFEAAAHDSSVAKRVGIPKEKAAEMAHEGVKKGKEVMPNRHGGGHHATFRKPMNPARPEHNLHPEHAALTEHGMMKGISVPREHPGGSPHGSAEKLVGDREHHDGHMGDKAHMNHPTSFKSVGGHAEQGNVKHMNKSLGGHGNPQGGATELPGQDCDVHAHGQGPQSMGDKMPENTTGHEHGATRTALADETRGTHELPPHQYAAEHAVPQEVKEGLARVLVRRHR